MTTGNDYEGHFHVDYDPESGYFQAYAWRRERDVWVLTEVSYSLDGLLQKCKEAGLTTLDGLTDAAIACVHEWLARDRPTIEYVENLWDGPNSSQSSKGPIGFQLPDRQTSDDADTSEDDRD
ncbi:MAG: hypothetical protein OXC95_17725 [Dehalococcoidia bacterium]|nr:hypothetical protein [Dehalococcoidia bacterium]